MERTIAITAIAQTLGFSEKAASSSYSIASSPSIPSSIFAVCALANNQFRHLYHAYISSLCERISQ